MLKVWCLLIALTTAAVAGPVSLRVSNISANRFPQVQLELNVFRAGGDVVTGVAAQDLKFDEGSASLTPGSVAVEVAPLELAIVVDVSSRMKPGAGALGAALSALLDQLGPRDRAALVSFGDHAVLDHELIADRPKLKAAVQKLKWAGGAALNDAIVQATHELEGTGDRTIILLITGGRDQSGAGSGAATLRSAAKGAHDRQIPIWIVGVGAAATDKLFLKLAAATGGQVYPAAGPEEIGRAAGQALADIRHQYRVVFRSPVPRGAGGARTLTVGYANKDSTGTVKVNYVVPEAPAPRPEEPGVIDVEPEPGLKPDMDPFH